MNNISPHFIFIGLAVILFILFKIRSSVKKKKVMQKISEGAKIIDVRTPSEFQSGHYQGAINIPVDKIRKNISRFVNKNNPLIVYCASGMRSSQAASILKNMGYNDILNAGSIRIMP